jgi:thiol-disulfide isomerase/thioredoxin
MNFKILSCALLFLFSGVVLYAGDGEYTGQFDTALVPNTENFEKVVFKHVTTAGFKGESALDPDAHVASGRLYDPQTGKFSALASLVEAADEESKPLIYVDLDGSGNFSDGEKFIFQQSEKDNPYLWNVTVNLPVKNSFFTACPLFLQYFKQVRVEKMSAEDRLLTQSTDVMARGKIEVKGKKILTQYAYSFEDKKITPQKGWLGVDGNEDGAVDMDELSSEAAKADDETIVFRVGQMYLSTKKADLSKNQIVMREHEAKDYKRIELAVGKEFPEFSFVDLGGKKRRFSEYRGKYILLDVWGFWCPPCRREMPYLREASKRFQTRNLEIVGLNTDVEMPLDILKKNLETNDLRWTQAQLESVFDLINKQLRIESFPTTFLIAPDGKILSMSRHLRGEPDLRGKDLLETLDEILPK